MASSSSKGVKTKGLVKRKNNKRRSSNKELILSTKRQRIPKNNYTPGLPKLKKRKKATNSEKTRVNTKKRCIIIEEEQENDSNNQRMNDIAKLKNLVTALNPINYSTQQNDTSSIETTSPANLVNNESRLLFFNNLRHDLRPSPQSLTTSPINNQGHSLTPPSSTTRNEQLPRRIPVPRVLWNVNDDNHNNQLGDQQGSPSQADEDGNNDNYQLDDQQGPLPQADEDDDQLLGPDFQGGRMTELKRSIYCTDSVMKEISIVCRQGTSVARHLMVGVFNRANILDCTLTGRRVWNQGKERQRYPTKSLHNVARETIKEVAKEYAIRYKWPLQDDTAYDLAMTKKLGEMKREFQVDMQHEEYLKNLSRNRDL